MNKARRNELKSDARAITRAQEIISAALEDEENAYENMPESLQGTARGEEMYTAIDIMEAVNEQIEEILQSLDEIIEG